MPALIKPVLTEQQRILVILGMHRSGTSLISQWLNHCGLHIGNRLMAAGIGNTDGHFEDLDFVEWHQQVLSQNNLESSGLIANGHLHVDQTAHEKMMHIMASRKKHLAEWGWKDPRTCLFLDYYGKILPDANYLIIVRDYQSVVSSLLKRDMAFYEQQWQNSHSGCLHELRWKLHIKKRNTIKLLNRMAEYYTQVYIHYNHKLLGFAQKNRTSCVVVDYRQLTGEAEKTLALINNVARMKLHYYPYDKIYKPDLMQKKPFNLANYIQPALIQQAFEVEQQLLHLSNQSSNHYF